VIGCVFWVTTCWMFVDISTSSLGVSRANLACEYDVVGSTHCPQGDFY
jgi:hypothetical protein